MLTEKELARLSQLLQSLDIDLPKGIELEVAGIAILRFCLAKTLREAPINK